MYLFELNKSPFPTCYYQAFRKVELYHEHPYAYPTMNIYLYLLYKYDIYISIHLSIHQYVLCFDTFQSCRHQYVSLLNTSAWVSLKTPDF